MELWRPDGFEASCLPAVLKSKMTGLLGMFQKVYSLAAQSFRTRKKRGFSTELRPVLGKLLASWGRAVENLAVRLAPFSVRSRQCETGWVEIRVFLCL